MIKIRPARRGAHWEVLQLHGYYGLNLNRIPVPDGRVYYSYYCSECRHISTTEYNYCPHCGAKMEDKNA